MRYNVYIDTLFVINFVMNLYLYTLTRKTMKRTATRLRLMGVSAAGAVLSVVLLLLPGLPVFIKRFVGPMMISMGMTAVIFKLKHIRIIFRVTGYMFLYAFVLGGMMKFLFSVNPFLYKMQGSIWYILGAGMIGYQAVSWWLEQIKYKKNQRMYKVRLITESEQIWVEALMDTGNSLREPISGRPVAVLDEAVAERLQEIRRPEKLKIIPYRSVGKSNGIMEGYEVPEVMICDEEEQLRWQKVIVAISKTKVSTDGRYQMILHPDMCNESFGKASGI